MGIVLEGFCTRGEFQSRFLFEMYCDEDEGKAVMSMICLSHTHHTRGRNYHWTSLGYELCNSIGGCGTASGNKKRSSAWWLRKLRL